MKPAVRFALTVVTVALVAGCTAAPAPPEGPASIRGRVTSLTRGQGGDVLGTMLVEGKVEGGTQFDKASLTVTSKTGILRRAGDAYEEASFEDVREGVTVEVWITGPVRESYPVQADADTIVIDD